MNGEKTTRSTAALIEFALACLGVIVALGGIIVSSALLALLGLLMIVAGIVLLANRRRTRTE